MAVRLRLTRVGGRKDPVWRVVVADQRSKRDGRVIETIGHYNPQTNPSTITLDESEGQIFEPGYLPVAHALHARLWPMWQAGKVG